MFESILIFLGILFLGGFVQGLTGFGLALISVSLLSLIIDPKLSVPIASLYGWLVTMPIVVRMWRKVHLKESLLLVISSFPGTYLGAMALKNLSSSVLLYTKKWIMV